MIEKNPYKNIGERLRKWRQSMHESLAEVSGAVEIDAEQLRKIEEGSVLPSEDILLLLISHLDVQEHDAKKLFEYAGYNNQAQQSGAIDEQLIKQMLMIIPFDNRVMYSDSTNVSANQNGVVLEFMQSNAGQQQSVARIGMSVKHLESLTILMQSTLDNLNRHQGPKGLLGAPKKDNSQEQK